VQFFTKTVIVKDNERALVTRDGVFSDILGPGRHRIGRRVTVEVVPVHRAECPLDIYRALNANKPELAANTFTVVTTGGSEAAIVFFDGTPAQLIHPWQTRVFWKVATDVTVRRFDTMADGGRVDAADQRLLVSLIPKGAGILVSAEVQASEVGLLYRSGVLEDILPPGRHMYWSAGTPVSIVCLDVRPQAVEITAQEILTRDRIQVRLTATLFYRIVDPRLGVSAAVDLSATLYKLVQFALREAVATRSLDDLIASRDELSRDVRTAVEARIVDFGVRIMDLGVKDVILPGEIRDLLNKVVEAERTAKANLIRRQEETAATRSLLNTARLMEDNPLLLRLKELETLERLVEKVGRIDLHASQGAGPDSLLNSLIRPASALPPA
jgi:regulator of protease activity HflC (stomatin/prohibitin superfamily)